MSSTKTVSTQPEISAPVSPPRFAKTREWTKLIAITGSAQVAVQAIGFVCGILVIRLLPVQEYAYYTIANTMLGTMTILADGGIASGVMSQGGKVWQDKQKLGAVLATGMKLRRQFAVWSLAVAMPILYFLLIKQGASWITATMIAASLLPAFFSALSSKLLEISAKLHQDVAALQIIQVTSNTLRLLLSGLMLFVFPFAVLAILASGISQIYGNWRLLCVSEKFAERKSNEDLEVRHVILGVVRRALPGAVYSSLSGQITVWLIAIFGTTEMVAQIGALGRLAVLFSIVTTTVGLLIAPRFARLPNVRALVLKRFLQIQVGVFTMGAIIFAATLAFPEKILWLLGEKYADMTTVLVLLTSGRCISLLSAISHTLCYHRGFIPRPEIFFPIVFASQVAGITILDFSKIEQAVLLPVFTFTSAYLLRVLMFVMWLIKAE